MEGQVCSEERCHCVDFLPFECALCGNVYCLEHRSRFNHSCTGMSVVQPLVRPTQYASVKEMMDAVEHRHDGEKNGNHVEHHQIKSSAPEVTSDSKFVRKIQALGSAAENASSSKQRKINLKTREMLIKTKAKGNSSVSGADRLYMCVHFAGSMGEAEAQQHHSEYLFYSSTKTIGEVMKDIWQRYRNTVEHSAAYLSRTDLHNLRRDHITLALSTADSPHWQHWDRNWELRDCLTNYEDIAVFPVTVDEVIANQQAIAAAERQALEQAAEGSAPMDVAATEEEEEDATPAEYEKRVFQKGDAVWYHKVPAARGAKLSPAQMEARHPMVMAKITGVHHDDFPNIYYSVQMETPPRFTTVDGSVDLAFHHEKQTDHTHLLPPSSAAQGGAAAAAGTTNSAASTSAAPSAGSATARAKAGDAASLRQEQAAAAHAAAVQLQETLAALGKPISIRVGFTNREYGMKIGSQCTVAQLKMLISAVTEVPVPAMRLIVKGAVLKDDRQLVKDTKIGHNSKVVVMSSSAHVV